MSITIDGSANTIVGSGVYTLTSPTLVTPVLGTPTSGDLRNCSLAVAPAIGSTTPSTGAFTTLSATTSVGATVATFTNTGTTPLPVYVYTGNGLSGISSGATLSGNAFYFEPTVAKVQANNVVVATFSSAGLAVTGTISATTTIKTGGYTVGTLPAGVTGDRAYVTDATAPTYLGALTGGGAVVCPVFKNATAWVSA